MLKQQHQRLNEILHAYWDSLCAGNPYPREQDIDPASLSEIWDSCFLIKNLAKQTERKGYRYDYLGKALIQAFGGDMTNKEISDTLIDPASAVLVKQFDKVIATGKPVEQEAEFTNTQGLLIKYRCCMLPLGGAQGGVNFILGGMKWKSF